MQQKPFRVAMLGHKRIPSREGGVEIVVGELASRMAKRGYAVTCFNRRGHHVSGAAFDEAPLPEFEGVKCKTVWTVNKKGLAAMTASFFAAVCAAFGKYDVVHFHAEGPCAMMWIPKLFGKRCVATIHGLDHKRAKWGNFASRYILAGEKCAVRYADTIIVLSRNVQQYFKDTYDRETVWVPNGVLPAKTALPDVITARYGLHKDEYILFVGRLVPEKGIHYLIEAYRHLNTDKKLVIAGGSSDSAEYAEEVKRLAGGDKNIIFTGFVQGQTLDELYSNAYVYVLPSDLEGMPLTLLEAMSFGNCCLTSNIPECADVFGDAGVTFARGEVQDLREKLQVLCDNPQKVEQLKAESADVVCRRYNWDDITERTLRIYGAIEEKPVFASEEEITYESVARQ